MSVVRGKLLVWSLLGITALALMALAAACGGGDDGGGGGASGAEGAVEDFILGWEKASGLRRNDIAAGEIRQLLGGELFAGVDGVLTGGASPGSSSELGSTRRLDQIYNDYMMVPITPDGIDGELFQILTSSASDDGESATVQVKLLYTAAAASAHAAVGNIDFEEVNEVHAQVITGPVRTFVLEKVDGDWKIVEINEG
jgi:hypothetical protein